MSYREEVLRLSETFHSFQGEGQWVGTPMHFVRFAGCNVGKPAKALKIEGPFPILQSKREASACTTWDGRIFPCDTDYSHKLDLTPEIILHNTWEKHICVTGGEPLLHYEQIENLFALAQQQDKLIHIETSGTVLPRKLARTKLLPGYWVTVSPKIGALSDMIERADELKILVDHDFRVDRLTIQMMAHRNVFLCPVNDVDDVRKDNVHRCELLLREFPHWRLSWQAHKVFGWR